MIVSTSAAGSLMVVAAIVTYTGGVRIVIENGHGDTATTTNEWAFFGGWLALTALGVVIQFMSTAVGQNHRTTMGKAL